MNKDVFLATALLKQMVDAGGQRFEVAWLIEKSGVTRKEVLRGLKQLKAWQAVIVAHESEDERREVVGVTVTDATYEVYRKLFSGAPPS